MIASHGLSILDTAMIIKAGLIRKRTRDLIDQGPREYDSTTLISVQRSHSSKSSPSRKCCL